MKQDIPHGHGLSFKKGVADALLSECRGYRSHKHKLPNGHSASYRRGYGEGVKLKKVISKRVRPNRDI